MTYETLLHVIFLLNETNGSDFNDKKCDFEFNKLKSNVLNIGI